MKNRIVFVVDIRGHAFDLIAKDIVSKFDIVVIYWSDFTSSKSICRKLSSLQPSIVHFFWRKQLENVFEEIQVRGDRYSNLKNSHFTFSIPDHLYSNDQELIDSFELLRFATSYIVTSKKLMDFYVGKFFIPNPHSVIYDRTFHVDFKPNNRSHVGPLKVLWVGNSSWGEWIGKIDHKGLRSVIEPAIAMVNKASFEVALSVVDSSVTKYTHSQVLDFMKNSDVILQFSDSEGTGLPLLEASLCGALPLTTDVGIATEFIPEDLQNLLVIPRNAKLLATRLKFLATNREILEAAQLATQRSALDFIKANPKAWDKFFTFVIGSDKPSGLFAEKQSRWTLLRKRIRLLLLSKRPRHFAKKILEIFPRSRRIFISNYLHLQNFATHDFKFVPIQKVDTLAIYCPKWIGVSNSTRNIFNNSFPIPHLPSIEPDFPTLLQLQNYSDFLIQSIKKRLIISGGDMIHIELAKLVAASNPNIDIRVLWHGGIALMTTHSEYAKFKKIIELYHEGIISGIDFVKPGLPDLMLSLGIDSHLLLNHTNYDDKICNFEIMDDLIEDKVIGVFASSPSWWKNYWNQYFALRLLQEAQGNIIFDSNELDNVFEFNSNTPKVVPFVTDPNLFKKELLNLDILLYVTFVECSPMLPLEAMALGVVVLVGPSTEYITGTPLEKFLLVKNPDSPLEIMEKARFACDNLEMLREMQFEFLSNYTKQALLHNDYFLNANSLL